MEATKSALLNLLFFISISAAVPGIHVRDKDVEYHTFIRDSSLRDHYVIIVDSSERHRRQASMESNPLPTNASQTEGKTLVVANTTTNDVNRTTSTPLPTTSTPQSIIINDTHEYYTSTVLQSQADNYWVELSNATLHQDLRNTSMTAKTIQFKYSSYLFYGHQIYNVTITTGGFLYMSPFVHSLLMETQYTAPLMANFGTLMNNSDVYFQEYDDRFIVEWRNVYLVDQEEFGPFKFQTILCKNGSIVFIYQKVPVAISNISSSNHRVKIGLSDAFYIDKNVGLSDSPHTITRVQGWIYRTIYNYHTVKVNFTYVKAKTVIIFNPLPTCNLAKDCITCVTQKTTFNCLWCAKVQRCSDSLDWHRQDWIENGCPVEGHNSTDLCNGTKSKPTPEATTTTMKNITGTPVPTSKTLNTNTPLTSAQSPTITSTPASSSAGLTTNQTTKTTLLSPTSRELTTSKTTSQTTALRKLPTTITTPKTTTLTKETSQMSITNSTTMASTLKPNTTTTNQTTKTTSPSPSSQKLTTTTTTPHTTTLRKLATNITTPKTTTLRKETSQKLTANTTTMTTTLKPNTTIKPSIKTTVQNTTTLRTTESSTAATVTKQSNSTVAPCNKTKDGTCGQGSQPTAQKQSSQASGSSNAPVIAIVIVLVLIVLGAIIGLVVYAYRHPTSAPGQWLIKNRPSALREKIKNVRENFFGNISDSSEKYRLESESEL